MANEKPGQQVAVRKLFEETRKRLVETGTRNRLVHVNRQSRRSNSLDIINERSNDVYSILVKSGRTMRFFATGRDKEGESDTPSLVKSGKSDFDENRFTDNQLETRFGPDDLQKRLLKLARDAKTAEEEQGVNILYLALGFMTWFEDDTSSVKREAPLVLLPVELVRNARSSSYELKIREDDVVTNLPLQERIKGDFGIRIPDVDDTDDWTPSLYFDAVEEAIVSKGRWIIDRDGMQLGFFSFSKLLMFRDLDPENWPENALEAHVLTSRLLYGGFEIEEPMFGKEDNLDEKLPTASLFHVVDADASQAKVVEEVRSGRNLVVQGPPGTGKSQTITNIIAAAVQDGKRVLFVAEKMAALSVVHKRLVDVGLADICLELHSKTANKKAVLGELARTLNAGHAIPDMPPSPDKLQELRNRLNQISKSLHQIVDQSGDSAFTALSQQVGFLGHGAPPPVLNPDGLSKISRDQADHLTTTINDYISAVATAGPLADHPFSGVEKYDLQPTDLARLAGKLITASKVAENLADAIEATSSSLGLKIDVNLASAPLLVDQLNRLLDPPKLDDALLEKILKLEEKRKLSQILATGAEWRKESDENSDFFVESVWSADVTAIRASLAAGQSSFLVRWGSGYRHASRQLAGFLNGKLPNSAAERTNLADKIIRITSLRKNWQDDKEWCANILGNEWQDEATAFSKLVKVLDWCDRASGCELVTEPAAAVALARKPVLINELAGDLGTAVEAKSTIQEVVEALCLDLVFSFQADTPDNCNLKFVALKFKGMLAASDRYDEWSKIKRLRDQLQESNLVTLLGQIDSGTLGHGAAATEFQFARAEAIWKRALETTPLLATLRNENRHELVQKFVQLEKVRREDCVKIIRNGHLQQLPQGAIGHMGIIRSEIGKKKAHIPIRRLFSSAAEAIQRIKPVLMMSPISVAQFLPPGLIKFDLLVFDEASQVKPEDALGAVARANQIVVVGDQKQLPPSSFFDRLASEGTDEEDEEYDDSPLMGAARVGDLESILTLCEARGLPSRMLEWHYRSRDPSLIRVSNHEFYKDGLILPPSPVQNDPSYGMVFTRVAGIYDRGGKRNNRLEAESIVMQVIEHAGATPSLSVGIVTFSSAQRNLISELLEYHRRNNAVLDLFLREGNSEDVFVKNIENVQGDERDVILVSVGYGPTEAGGRLRNMSFGPVNSDGGERRLNVLFTRARVRCEVFCSFDPGDIDLTKVTKEGPKVLKRFLEFAKTGLIDDKVVTGTGPDTPFEADVADAIKVMGYSVDYQVGSAGFLIDLGVRHPGRPGNYILAVECDGATYHSALWARERDRLRQAVLEQLGWRFHRIWSTDWFYRREPELERLRTALNDAKKASDEGIVIRGANDDKSVTLAFLPADEPDVIEAPPRTMPYYVKAELLIKSSQEPHEVDLDSLARYAFRVVEIEGPVLVEEIARRIATAYGKRKAGKRIVDRVQEALNHALNLQQKKILERDDFWMTNEQADAPPVRDRSRENGPLCKASNISMSEITRALQLAIDDNAGGSDQDIIRAAAQLFGFKRVGADLQARLEAGIKNLH